MAPSLGRASVDHQLDKSRSGGDVMTGDGFDDDAHQHGEWEDYTCATPWEDFVRALEDVLREWKACGTDLVESELWGGEPSSRCLEHDGQLFSVQLVPGVRSRTPTASSSSTTTRGAATQQAVTPSPASRASNNTQRDSGTSTTNARHSNCRRTATTEQRSKTPQRGNAEQFNNVVRRANRGGDQKKYTTSEACELSNPGLDFLSDSIATPPQRWFGLKQYILLRALGREGQGGMGIDQLLWATTVAAGNCNCSVPVLVSCDWYGLDSEGRELERGRPRGEDATCKGYSTPGAKRVACSVRFQSASTCEPPVECLFLDGLSKLFLSKLRDAQSSPGLSFAPRVTTSIQQVWEWSKPENEIPVPAPSMPWMDTCSSSGSDDEHRAHVGSKPGDRRNMSPDGGGSTPFEGDGVGNPPGGWRVSSIGNRKAGVDVSDNDGVFKLRRDTAAQRLLNAIRQDHDCPLWGPIEDPLVSVSVRVRWTELSGGLAEENRLFTTLDPMQGVRDASFGDHGWEYGGPKGHWFVQARWKTDFKSPGSTKPSSADGRLASACFRLLAALVLTTAMHPGTLMADLGGVAGPDSPTIVAEDYAKDAAAALSAETRASVERMCSKNGVAPVDIEGIDSIHDGIDAILRRLLHPDQEGEGGHRTGAVAPSSSSSSSLPSSLRSQSLGAPAVETRPAHGVGGRSDSNAVEGRKVFVGGGGGSSGGRDGATGDREISLWVWADRGGAPVGRLLSLLAVRIADCEDLATMSLLWMSFVRDVRLLWEEGVTIARMRPISELDGMTMFDPGASGTGQNRSIAARLRACRARTDHGSRPMDGCGGGGAGDCHGHPMKQETSSRDGHPYPDMRMCLIWQKLQMLGFCRAATVSAGSEDGGDEAEQPNGCERSNRCVSEEEDDDDDADFYDTVEYQPRSDDEQLDEQADRVSSDDIVVIGDDSDRHRGEKVQDATPPVGPNDVGEESGRAIISDPERTDDSANEGDGIAERAANIGEVLAAEAVEATTTAEAIPSSTVQKSEPSAQQASEKLVNPKSTASPTVPDKEILPPTVGGKDPLARVSKVPFTGELRLLLTGVAVRPPLLLDSGPVTADMLDQQMVGQAGVHRSREVIVEDMKAFRDANCGSGPVVFADFVRWYRPECWQSFTEGGEWVKPSDREGGSPDDDLRLAWPGQGQVLWRDQADVVTPPLRARVGESSLDLSLRTEAKSAPALTLAGWMSCWEYAFRKEQGKRAPPPLFDGVKEGEKALHYLETVSPGSLFVQLLSALLGVSVFVLEEACRTSANGVPAAKDTAGLAGRKAREAVEMLAGASSEVSGVRRRSTSEAAEEGEDVSSGLKDSKSSFRAALLAADSACLEVDRAERTLSRAVSLQRALPNQEELVNEIVKCEWEGHREVLMEDSLHKRFIRELLIAHARKTMPKSVEELVARLGEDRRRGDVGADGNHTDRSERIELRIEAADKGGGMPPAQSKEYVLRCQTSAPFYDRNLGRAQMESYPTPPSRMYAKADAKGLRVAFSICESEL